MFEVRRDELRCDILETNTRLNGDHFNFNATGRERGHYVKSLLGEDSSAAWWNGDAGFPVEGQVGPKEYEKLTTLQL